MVSNLAAYLSQMIQRQEGRGIADSGDVILGGRAAFETVTSL